MSLADEMANDLENVFFNIDDFAVLCTYSPVGGTSYPVHVIFDKAFSSVNMEGTIPVASTSPMAKLRESELQAAPAPGDMLIISGNSYRILEPEPDGHGIMVLRLHEV